MICPTHNVPLRVRLEMDHGRKRVRKRCPECASAWQRDNRRRDLAQAFRALATMRRPQS